MSKLWRDPKTKQHIPYRERKSLSGTARYMSINTHLGRGKYHVFEICCVCSTPRHRAIPTRRSGRLRSRFHVFLAWRSPMARPQGRYQQAEVRENRREEAEHSNQRTLRGLPRCAHFIVTLSWSYTYSLLPEEFSIYLNYVRKLGFEESPDYDFLRELFTKVLKNAGEVEDNVFDWMLLNGGKGWEVNPVRFMPRLAPGRRSNLDSFIRRHPTCLRLMQTTACREPTGTLLFRLLPPLPRRPPYRPRPRH